MSLKKCRKKTSQSLEILGAPSEARCEASSLRQKFLFKKKVYLHVVRRYKSKFLRRVQNANGANFSFSVLLLRTVLYSFTASGDDGQCCQIGTLHAKK